MSCHARTCYMFVRAVQFVTPLTSLFLLASLHPAVRTARHFLRSAARDVHGFIASKQHKDVDAFPARALPRSPFSLVALVTRGRPLPLVVSCRSLTTASPRPAAAHMPSPTPSVPASSLSVAPPGAADGSATVPRPPPAPPLPPVPPPSRNPLYPAPWLRHQ
eukprot:scaffold115974_cov63-Phaeocystis_antarctica.AAC.4